MSVMRSNFKNESAKPRQLPEGRMDLTGEKYEKLTVLGFWELTSNVVHWLCRCDCGKKLTVRHGNIRAGRSTKCSDCRDADFRQMACENKTHGLSKTLVHYYWCERKDRFADVWRLDLAAFNEQCFKKRPKTGLRLVPIDDSKPIGPDNYKWTDQSIVEKTVVVDGITMTSNEARKKLGVSRQRISQMRMRQSGLCNCGNKPVKGLKVCSKCRETQKRSNRKKRKK